MKHKIQLFVFALILGSFSLAQAQWSQGTLNLPANRVLAYDSYRSSTPGPVFIFLPGIYRGPLRSDPVTAVLVKEKFSFVLMHFAEHPDSVVQTRKVKEPDFAAVDAQSLADEVKALVQKLSIQSPVPVTLSYSAILTSHLDASLFPVVVETSPIGSATDSLPTNVALFYEAWEKWIQNLPYGEAWLRENKKMQLRPYWQDWVNKYSQRLTPLKDPVYNERALQGYIALTLASEGFDLREQDFKKGPRRIFILGDQEESRRAEFQKEAIGRYESQRGETPDVFEVPQAGHNVPADQPEAYVALLKSLKKSLRNR